MTDPRDLRLLMEHQFVLNRNFTAGNLGIGSVYGLVPFDLAGQRKPSAEDDEEEDEALPGRTN